MAEASSGYLQDYTFCWKNGGHYVTLLGSFDDWQYPGRVMTRVGDTFSQTIPLPIGQYEYGYLVDGLYRFDEDKTFVPNLEGGFNNICKVTAELPVDCTDDVKLPSSREQVEPNLGMFPVSSVSTDGHSSINYDYLLHDIVHQHGNSAVQMSVKSAFPKSLLHKVKITCLPKSVTKAELEDFLKKHSKFKSLSEIKGSTNKYAWVNFESRKDAVNAVECIDGYCFRGSTISVSLKSTHIDNPLPDVQQDAPQGKKFLNQSGCIASIGDMESQQIPLHEATTVCFPVNCLNMPSKVDDCAALKLPVHTACTETISYTAKIICLPKTVTKTTLTNLVEKHCTLVSVSKIHGTKNKYAWVNLKSPEDVINAVKHFDGYCFDGSIIRVNVPINESKEFPYLEHATCTVPQEMLNEPTHIHATPIEKTQIRHSEAQEVDTLCPSIDCPRVSPDIVNEETSQAKKKNPEHETSRASPIKEKACQLVESTCTFKCSTFEHLKLKIECEQKNVQAICDQEISELKHSHDQIKIKNCPLQLLEALQEQKKSLISKIAEIENKRIEFVTVCQKLTRLCVCTRMSYFELEQLKRRFLCESSKYKKGLPIYSHRRHLMDMIKNHQVSILTAETGSGKSTQLVQYLYEENFATSGLIVCTQPRKVAAISLAKFVSSEMLTSLGKTVGYKTGLDGSHSEHTKVVYITDQTLLNECVLDPNFSRYSCLVVDEAHERNLTTDILLAFIKQCLPRRPDLRVVITSATIDPQKFVRYFGSDCPVKSVPGRTFPVEVIYCPNVSKQFGSRKMPEYVSRAVELASKLHKNESSGDILVFLTSPAEVEQACQRLEMCTNNTACVLPLHGKLQPDAQQKVFKEYSQRKIIFSTNVAETSVTIPGVKYIVDSGFAKELCFDAKRNINSLEVRLICKSSAEQRKGRAGRTNAGKCYRLYSEDEYKGMSDQMIPEILRVSLSGTILKLYELGITDVYNFDFIEKPETEALKLAVETLQHLGAIYDNKLTDTGKSMAVLPVNPRLAKVILDGLKENVGLEAIATTAISSLAGTVFFRSEENKEQSDLLKSTFCVPEGDQLTDFNAYFQWTNVSNQERNSWCVKNSINAKSMRLVEQTAAEITKIVKKRLKEKIVASSLSFERATGKLPNLFFKSFASNLCVFLGHEKVGYLNPALPNEKLVLFPGSSVCKLNTQPKYLIYEKTLKTSQHFLLQVLPVDEEWIEEALKFGLICHPMECNQFSIRAVTPFIIKDLGKFTMDRIVHGQKSLFNEPVFTAISGLQVDKCPIEGTLKVFVPKWFHEEAKSRVQQFILSIKKELQLYRLETGISVDTDNVRVLIGSGGSISKILMPHEYRSVFVRGPIVGVWGEKVTGDLRNCGTIQKESMASNASKKEQYIRVTFHESDNAVKACALTMPPDVYIMPDQSYRPDKSVYSFTIKIEWNRRERRNFVNLNLRTPYHASQVTNSLQPIYNVAGVWLRFRISKHDSSQVFVANMHPHLFSEEAAKNEFDHLLMPLGYSRDSYDVIFAYSENFNTSTEDYERLEEKLHDLMSFIPKAQYHLHLLEPKDFHKVFKAFVNFTNIDEGMAVFEVLKNASINGKTLRVSQVLSSSIKHSASLYAVVQKSVEEVCDRVKLEYKTVKITSSTKDSCNIIRVESNDPTDHIPVIKLFNSVLEPEVIDCSSQLHFEYMRSKECEQEIVKTQDFTCTIARRDFRQRCIKIYGLKENVTKAKAELNKSLSFCVGTNYYVIDLSKSGQPPGLLKFFLTTFDIDLHLLSMRPGIEMVRIDVRKHQLVLFASESGYQGVQAIIDDFCKNNLCIRSKDSAVNVVVCCACYTSIDNLESMYRLEYCGHAYHFDCIEAQLLPDAVTIPIECAAEGCTSLFLWQDVENLKQKGKVDSQAIITKSVQVYVAANKKTVHNCPTPDCSMMYTITSERKCFLCVQCGVLTCTKCHKPFHSGYLCTQFQDEEVKVWLHKDPTNRKFCPKCSAAIEKNGGCAHVTCTNCHAHICWHCLHFFSSQSDCYGHLRQKHGGFL